MTDRTPSRYWIVRKPDEQGAVVARFDTPGETYIDPAIADHDDFVVQSVPSRSALVDRDIDTDGLTDEERRILGYDQS